MLAVLSVVPVASCAAAFASPTPGNRATAAAVSCNSRTHKQDALKTSVCGIGSNLRSCIEHSFRPNTEDAHPQAGEPPLHRAARLGDHAAIRALVAAGADLNAAYDNQHDEYSRQGPATPLMFAAGSKDGASGATVSLLLELGADPRIVIEGASAATCAFEGLEWGEKMGGDATRARLVLEAGSPLPTDPERANELLCGVAEAGDAERLRLLLARGVNPKGHWDPVAARERATRFREWKNESRDPRASTSEGNRSLVSEMMDKMDQEMFERQCTAASDYEIPLFRAAKSGNAECVRLLLEAGADPTVRDSSKCTAMYTAASPEVVQALLRAGLLLEDSNCYGWSPLYDAVNDGEAALPRLRALIACGANVNATHDHGYTVFMSAVGTNRHPAILRLLIAAGADPHAVSELGYNAFHAAIDVNFNANAEESVRDTLGYLKELGVNIEQRNNRDLTPLAFAIERGTSLEVRVLCELGADPHAVCSMLKFSGNSCTRAKMPLLFYAANGPGVDMHVKVEALLKAGADPLVKDAEGFTPLVRSVASLCSGATDYPASFAAFFKGLTALRLDGKPMPTSRDAFVAEAMPVVQHYVECFSREIPVSMDTANAETWRAEDNTSIAWLCAYEGWARHERSGHIPS